MKYKNTILCALCALCALGTYTPTKALFGWFGSYVQDQAKEGAKKGLVEGVPEAVEKTMKKAILLTMGAYFMKPLAQKIVTTPSIPKGALDPILKACIGGLLWILSSQIGKEKKQTFRQIFKNKFSTIYSYLNKKKKISASNKQQNNSSPFDPTDDL